MNVKLLLSSMMFRIYLKLVVLALGLMTGESRRRHKVGQTSY